MGKSRIQNHLKLAEKILSLSQDFLEALSRKSDRSIVVKMHMGFGKKMLSTFEALIADATDGRAEAVHHLKTLAEAYIYVRWIGNEERNARLVYAKMSQEKINFFTANKAYPISKDAIAAWEEARDWSISDLEENWKKDFNKGKKPVIQIAKECDLTDLYSRIYKLSCEAAHISDLMEFVPNESWSIGRERTSEYWAFIALDYGCFIMWSVLSDCNNLYALNCAEQLRAIKEEYDFLREEKEEF